MTMKRVLPFVLAALAFAPPAECAANGGATEDGAERTLAAALALYPALRRTLK